LSGILRFAALLLTISATWHAGAAAGATNVALASAGAVASASSTLSGYPVGAVNDGIRTGPANGFWADGTAGAFPDSVQVLFSGSQPIDRVVVYSVQDAYASPVEPTDAMTFSLYGLVDFTVEGWNGAAWVTLGTVTGNNLVKRTVTFAAFTTDRIRITVTNALAVYSRIVEIEAFGTAGPASSNVALASAGASPAATSTLPGYSVAAVNDGIRTGAANGFWADGTASAFPDTVQVLFNGSQAIDRVVVYSVQDAYTSPVEPTDAMTFSLYGLVDFTVEGWNGTAWVTLGTVTGNNLVKRTVTFAAFTTDRIRVNVTNAMAAYSRIVEIEAFGAAAGPSPANVALASAGAVTSASSTLAGYPLVAVNNGERAGAASAFWADGTVSTFPDWVQVVFSGTKAVDRVVVYSVQDAYTSPVEPTDAMTFSLYGLADFTVEGWNGAAWVPLGTVTGNNLVKRTVTFAAFTTDRIRVNVTNALAAYSRIVEIEAFGIDAGPPPPLATPTVTLASSLNPSTSGQAVTFTATASGSSGTPTGTVDFRDGGVSIAGCGAQALSGGVATCATSALSVATHSIAANYSGDGSYNSGTSNTVSQVVNAAVPATPTVVVTSSVNPSTSGQAVTFTATASGSSGTPTGTVDFRDGGVSIAGCGAQALSGGVATCATSSLAVATHSIAASYSGDATYAAATSGAVSQVVNVVVPSNGNYALASAGALASASSTLSGYSVAVVNDGNRTGAGGAFWADGTAGAYPDLVQVLFSGSRTIDRVVVYSVQDAYTSPVEPTATMTFSLYGLVDFTVEGWNGAAWVTLGTVTGNNLVMRVVAFPAFTTDRIRVTVTNALATYSRIVEIEALDPAAPPPGGIPVVCTTTATFLQNATIATNQYFFHASVNGMGLTGTQTAAVAFNPVTDYGGGVVKYGGTEAVQQLPGNNMSRDIQHVLSPCPGDFTQLASPNGTCSRYGTDGGGGIRWHTASQNPAYIDPSSCGPLDPARTYYFNSRYVDPRTGVSTCNPAGGPCNLGVGIQPQ